MSNIISKSVNSVVRLPIKSKLNNYFKLLRRNYFFDFTLDKILSNNHYIKELYL